MADIDFDGYGAGPRITGGQVQRAVRLAGAVCSAALIVGVGLWGYRLAMRDANGVPVFHAPEGPLRVAPSDPGGSVASHQGMAINVIAAAGGAGTMPEELVLAPTAPILLDEDVAGLSELPELEVPAVMGPPPAAIAGAEAEIASLAQVAQSHSQRGQAVVPFSAGLADSPPAQAEVSAPEAVAPEPVSPEAAAEDIVALALAEALGQDFPVTEAAPDTAAVEEAVGDGVAIRTSPRPQRRPGAGAAAVQAASVAEPGDLPAASEAPVAGAIDPASLQPGTRLVQLGAFDSTAQAHGEWARLVGRFGDLMSGKSVVVQAAESGGRTFYRLRAHGFEGADDARRFCAALLAEDAACIPVVHR